MIVILCQQRIRRFQHYQFLPCGLARTLGIPPMHHYIFTGTYKILVMRFIRIYKTVFLPLSTLWLWQFGHKRRHILRWVKCHVFQRIPNIVIRCKTTFTFRCAFIGKKTVDLTCVQITNRFIYLRHFILSFNLELLLLKRTFAINQFNIHW